ncbi:endocuticle structural protein SgAbd-6-like [Episyrphus balteatus]|uniref:endocuticle structural protein SgAbd-6-like n=1 Tax=Episyrphus balteatus TaxID=286459 RepID=UPI002485E627|nr:endocuticle structural protein SgAbd-6-like [Episyrphus balteatus]XP_055846604.1 endocuticle structural protein SgAbd-6-like [Episyrphus balteatus]
MKFTAAVCLIALLAVTVSVTAAPIDDSKSAVINEYDNDNIGVDGYKFSFLTSDGTSRKETAILKNIGTDEESISVEGSVSWVAANGQVYKLTYKADENGYQPEGDHLPKLDD